MLLCRTSSLCLPLCSDLECRVGAQGPQAKVSGYPPGPLHPSSACVFSIRLAPLSRDSREGPAGHGVGAGSMTGPPAPHLNTLAPTELHTTHLCPRLPSARLLISSAPSLDPAPLSAQTGLPTPDAQHVHFQGLPERHHKLGG